tara:strand:- start:115 stop:1869 length:1755 start_codon:yes stop_codon:yes gene_type:complete
MFNEAVSLSQANNFNAAKAIYEKLSKQLPANLDVINNLALINANTQDFTTAKKLLEKSLLIKKEQPQVIENLINILLDLKDYPYAIKLCDESIKLAPNNSITLFNKARALSGLERNTEALETYKLALKNDPTYYLAYQNLGYILNKLNKYEDAIKYYNQAIELNPKNVIAFYNKGVSQGNLLMFDEAIESYKIALEIDISFLPASLNMGKALEKLGKYKHALNIYDKAQIINPTNTEIYLNRGELHANQNKYNEAIFDFKKIKEINSNKNNGIYNIALLNLKFRKFENAWDMYDLRWQIKQRHIITNKPALKNLKSEYRRLFIWAEQGIGDQIYPLTILHNLISFFEAITISVDPRMVLILKRSFKQYTNIKIISSNDNLEEDHYDAQIPICSLGRLFIKNQMDIDTHAKPFLKSDAKKTALLKKNLEVKDKILCGLSWKSSNSDTGFNRSIQLEKLISIFKLNKFEFINLQYGDCDKEIKSLAKKYKVNITNVSSIDNFKDLNEYTSLVDACDLIISISNSCIHFAGALNKKSYLLLPYAIGTHWYWGTNQIKSEWYPSVSILRQDNPNDWKTVISKLEKEIS